MPSASRPTEVQNAKTKNRLAELEGVEKLQDCRNVIDDLVKGNPITKSSATRIHNLYKFPNGFVFTPSTLRAAVMETQDAFGSLCVNEEDYVTYESIKEVPYPLLVRLQLPNDSFVCVSLADLALMPVPINPITREVLGPAAMDTVIRWARQVITIMSM
jgi:hypothetical protein